MSEESINGNGKRKGFDVRDIQHWGIVLNVAQLAAVCSAIWFFADMKNAWENHKETDQRHWSATWTLPEMIHWCNAATKQTKMELPDPYETSQRLREMKSN